MGLSTESAMREHDELAARIRGFLAEAADGQNPEAWTRMARDSRVQGIAIPAAYGGGGHGPVEQMIVMREIGRGLFRTPYLSTAVLAAGALLDSGDEQACQRLLPRIATEGLTATVVLPGGTDTSAVGTVTAQARRTARGHRVTGGAVQIVDGHGAAVFVVAARLDGRSTLFTVDGADPGVERSSLTAEHASVAFRDAPATLFGEAGAAEPILQRTLRRAALALAAEQWGGAQRCLAAGVEYARERKQFGRPIGAFQAISHKCADMRLAVEAAGAAVRYAAEAAASDSADADWAASTAKAVCSDGYLHVADINVQIHGGAGYGWDSEAQAHLRRAQDTEYMFGSPGEHRALCADWLAEQEL